MTKKKSKKERVSFHKNMNTAPVAEQHKAEEALVRAESALSAEPHSLAAPAGAVSAQGESAALSVEHKRQRVYDDVRAQREARRGRDPHRQKGHGHSSQDATGKTAVASPAGYVRRSTLYLSVVLALVAGLFVGPLLPGLAGHSISGGQTTGQGVQAGQAGQPADSKGAQDDIAIKLAGHILELEEAVRKNPEDTAAWVQLGNLYFDSSKAPQAINAYERALLLKPANANVLTDLGIMYREVGKFEQAVESFRKATLVDKKHENALFNRGVVLFFDLKRKEEGRKAWQELLVLNPQAKAPDGKPLKDMLRDLK